MTDELELSDRLLARAVSTEVFIHLEKIDEADEIYDYQAKELNNDLSVSPSDITIP